MIRILCYGDSNTWGYIPGTDHERFGLNERWTRVLQQKLGNDFEVIEEGLNSRTLFSDDNRPGKEGRNGFTYLKPCMDSHDKFDYIVLMLGTNELKYKFNNSAKDIVDMIDRYVKFILNYKSQIDHTSPKLVISGGPIANENTSFGRSDDKFKGATEKSKELNTLLENYCNENNIPFIDNSDLAVGSDGIHFTRESHAELAEKLSKMFKNL